MSAVRPVLATVAIWSDMIKLAHSVFALPFALVAAVFAARHRSLPVTWVEYALVVACMVAARSFAMTFNRLADQAFDKRNPRTASRPLASGALSRSHAAVFCIGAAVLFALFCAGFLLVSRNPWPVVLAPIVLAYLAGYSFAKRFTSLSHLWLGAAIATAPAAAWIAIDPRGLGAATALLVVAAASWIAGFDIIYACQDVEVDRRDGLHSLPARWGVVRALWASRVCHVITIAALAALPAVEPLGIWYGLGIAASAVLLSYEQWLVRGGNLSRVNMAFFTLNGVIGVVFGVCTIVDVVIGGRRA